LVKKDVKILQSENVFICGMNGTGKTWLAKVYAAGFPNVIALDTKGTMTWDVCNTPVPIYTHLEELMSKVKEGKAIYRPDFTELNAEYYEAFFQWCYLRRNTTVVVDEVMQVCPSPTVIPLHYKGILTRGRELNVNVFSLTQRPKTIPLAIMSESVHSFIFKLNLEDDRKRIHEIIPYPEVLEVPGSRESHLFWYYNQNEESAPVRARLSV
jgi:hypothetical protein